MALRHDIQVLADHGVIKGPITSWPLSWDALAQDLGATDDAIVLPDVVERTLRRLQARALQETRRGDARFRGRLRLAEKPTAIRSFENTPREDAELTAGFAWFGDHLSIDLKATAVDSPADGKDYRADGSEIGLSLGNFTLAASTMERWWGPGWDGSLILSNNARPIPALVLRRNLTNPFKSKWLRWIGPWDLHLIWGQMEEDRAVPNARFFGMRVNFKPHPSLEIGISRTAQWCGDGRPCDFDTFIDMLLGKDNIGDAGTTPANEPGNQLAGFDFRWSKHWFYSTMAFYGQFIGEDEAGGFPSRYLAQGGLEVSGWSEKRGWSYRSYAELAGTSCDVLNDDGFNCAYNHQIYQTGYRYRGRAIGHGADNDALIGSLGLVLVAENSHQLHFLLRAGELNRGGPPDASNTLTATPRDLFSVDLNYSRPLGNSRIKLGIGYEQLEDPASGVTSNDARAFLQWRSNDL
ncbi:putative Uncharacterized 55.8 kDa protein in cps region [uncultured Woeseiaceae bacterium]|uniref:Putative Uncharacterized 55.8 kDa protein in cps region n=1 Tax=uncultured Woeseiaceae bacterium TaxID=1983305 RepID=A0A7D9D2K8_9GAMM|nr:putative Uncharacterized 55.8 kDa protein in cps region [uncultured Woeseiaceae bacterium]